MTFQSFNGPFKGYGVQDDAQDVHLLDFTFEGGAVNYTGRFDSSRRERISEIRALVARVTSGQGGDDALVQALVLMAVDIEKVIDHFSAFAIEKPEQQEYCARCIDAYQRARTSLDQMYAHFEGDKTPDILHRGYADLEAAVSEVDALLK